MENGRRAKAAYEDIAKLYTEHVREEAKQLAEFKGKNIEWSNQIGNALKIDK